MGFIKTVPVLSFHSFLPFIVVSTKIHQALVDLQNRHTDKSKEGVSVSLGYQILLIILLI